MKQAKGCKNTICKIYRKKVKFKSDDMFCPKCGNGLVAVCKNCRDPFPDGCDDVYCIRCQAEIDDKKEKRNANMKKIGGAVGGVAAAVVPAVIAKKIKPL